MTMKPTIQFIRLAAEIRVGDVIETGISNDFTDVIDVQRFDDGTVRLQWGFGENDAKTVSNFTGICVMGRAEYVIDV